jgi:RHS repeat-associated protein
VGGGTGLVDAQVSWDYNGNFTTRQDLKQGLTETFVYDALNRLDYSQRNGVTNLDVTLDAIGNVSWKSDVGSYSYHATKRRAVVSAGSHSYGYDANGNMVTRDGSTIGYASYNLPTSIAAGANTSSLSYGAWRNRTKQVAVTAGVTETTIYVAGLVEKVTKGTATEYRHLISGTPGTVAMYTRRSSGTNDTYYLHRDHLGSGELITNAAGTQVVKLSFSAYGERRDTDWDGPISSGDLTTLGNTTRHGFTDHEHLDSVGLIHMNGRVYDPLIGRFLSRDPYIDGVQNSQGANGYSYVWNNPLTRWDPKGYGGEEIDTRNECNPDCPQNWRDGVGARLSDTYVTVIGVPVWSSEQAFKWSWIDGRWTENIIRTDVLRYLYSPSLVSGPLGGGGPGGSTMPDGPSGGSGSEPKGPEKKKKEPEGGNNPGTCQFSNMFPQGNLFPVGDGFGPRVHPITGEIGRMHSGIDIRTPQGTQWLSPIDGSVAAAAYLANAGGGTVVVQGRGTDSSYRVGGQHLSEIRVSPGQSVSRGDPLALTGGRPGTRGAGGSTGPHLHFYVRRDGKMIDPASCYQRSGQ